MHVKLLNQRLMCEFLPVFSVQLATIRSESRLKHLLPRLPSYCPESLVRHFLRSPDLCLHYSCRPGNAGSLKQSERRGFLFLPVGLVLRFYLLGSEGSRDEGWTDALHPLSKLECQRRQYAITFSL